MSSSSKKEPEKKGSQLTILRIKRKRTDEPLEALLVQENEKKAKLNSKDIYKKAAAEAAASSSATLSQVPTMFRLAETVEKKSFSNLDEAQKLRERIRTRIHPGSSRSQTPTMEEKKDRSVKEQMAAGRKARYRVIDQNRSKLDDNMPPVVQSAEEKALDEMFKIHDAIKDDEEDKKGKNPKLLLDDDLEDPDDIMCNFIPMIKEYLTLNDKDEEKEDDDYVYDVYYRDDSHHQTDMKGVNIGSLVWFDEVAEYLDDDSDSELGDYVDEDSNAEDYYQNDYPDEEDSDEFEDQRDYVFSSDDDEDYM
ncbi:hypothetical protein K501DRAFT_288072 [Backusella circina FSU 941]|nr:hypothetical protein K501DRAFT_288072 [Backusella circina FSU 941]